MYSATLIYPHQLFHPHPGVQQGRLHIFIEEPLFFGDTRYPAKFHRQKLMLHRAMMKRFIAEQMQSYECLYLDYADIDGTETVFSILASRDIHDVCVVDPVDFMLEKRIRRYARAHDIAVTWLDSPGFINTVSELEVYFADKKKYYQTDFYTEQRKKLGVMLGADGGPIGGKWTYDVDNRAKFTKKQKSLLPPAPQTFDNDYIREARDYVEIHFPENPGETGTFLYPTSRAEALALMQRFVGQRLNDYGTYQDAITTVDPFLFHSLLSSSINTGLLSPMEVVEAAIDYADNNEVRLASLEGFVRQIIGWREFIRAVYVLDGVKQRTTNFFNQQRKLDQRFYDGTTGIAPIDDAITKANQYAYNHHIERLMLLGNFMVLCEIHPDEVYRWFMEMFIDAYDWVMVPNVYGMSQYADGGLMTTKPYISSSNYIRKMSDYGKAEWMTTWDGLYWRFINKHIGFFRSNPRLSMMSSHLKRMSTEKLDGHIQAANVFLDTLRVCDSQ